MYMIHTETHIIHIDFIYVYTCHLYINTCHFIYIYMSFVYIYMSFIYIYISFIYIYLSFIYIYISFIYIYMSFFTYIYLSLHIFMFFDINAEQLHLYVHADFHSHIQVIPYMHVSFVYTISTYTHHWSQNQSIWPVWTLQESKLSPRIYCWTLYLLNFYESTHCCC